MYNIFIWRKTMDNPLKKYFRQPKIFTALPTKGIFSEPGTYMGDLESMPVYGMTGMDEILMKTPDALLTGESTARVIESCCPVIKNAWGISVLDLDPILCAIRIATYGNTMSVRHTCSACDAENDYDIDLGDIVSHFKNCQYDGTINLKDITIQLRPLTYKDWTNFQLKTFGIQRQLNQASKLEEEADRNQVIGDLLMQVNNLQKEMLSNQIDRVEVAEGVVDQRTFINEWIANSEQLVYEKIKEQIEKNRKTWEVPSTKVICNECSAESSLTISLDQASFFGTA
jgi:hypothetical protein